MKKKVMSMLLVLTMAAGLFAGCGSDPAGTPDAGQNGEGGVIRRVLMQVRLPRRPLNPRMTATSTRWICIC